uniref:Uncharacterized protein n=1 Tax=Oryza brachyantha TaxID=4533 RepID=J3LPB6_ORYBR
MDDEIDDLLELNFYSSSFISRMKDGMDEQLRMLLELILSCKVYTRRDGSWFCHAIGLGTLPCRKKGGNSRSISSWVLSSNPNPSPSRISTA